MMVDKQTCKILVSIYDCDAQIV